MTLPICRAQEAAVLQNNAENRLEKHAASQWARKRASCVSTKEPWMSSSPLAEHACASVAGRWRNSCKCSEIGLREMLINVEIKLTPTLCALPPWDLYYKCKHFCLFLVMADHLPGKQITLLCPVIMAFLPVIVCILVNREMMEEVTFY